MTLYKKLISWVKSFTNQKVTSKFRNIPLGNEGSHQENQKAKINNELIYKKIKTISKAPLRRPDSNIFRPFRMTKR